MKFKAVVEYEYPIEHKPPVKAEIVLHGDRVVTDNIKWLKAEPCEDAISRQAAKAVVKKHFGQSIPWNSQPITEDLDALPPVQPTEKVGEWIYVKDRLPEEEGRYLCTYKYGNAYDLIIRKFINGGCHYLNHTK